MAIDATDAAKMRIGALGVSVDDTLDPNTLPTTWTTTGAQSGRNALDAGIAERVINRTINELYDRSSLVTTATNGFAGRFNNVVGNETGTDQAAFTALGGNIIQAVRALQTSGTGGPGGDIPEPPANSRVHGRIRAAGSETGTWQEIGGATPGSNAITDDFTEPNPTVVFGPNLTPNPAVLTTGFTLQSATGWAALWSWDGGVNPKILAYALTTPLVSGHAYWLTYTSYSGPPYGQWALRYGPEDETNQQILVPRMWDSSNTITQSMFVATGGFTHLVFLGGQSGAGAGAPRVREFVRDLVSPAFLDVAPTIESGWSLTTGSGPNATFTLATASSANLIYTLTRPLEAERYYLIRWRTNNSTPDNYGTASINISFRVSSTDTTSSVTTSNTGNYNGADIGLGEFAQVLMMPAAFTHAVVIGSGSSSTIATTFSFIDITPIEGEVSSVLRLNGVPFTIKDNNFMIGSRLRVTLTAEDNWSYGRDSLGMLTSGIRNVAVGAETMGKLQTGTNNVGIGYSVMPAAVSSSNTVAIGGSILTNLTSGGSNVAIGSSVATNLTSGSSNVLIGSSSIAANLTTGSNNIFIGTTAGRVSSTGSNSVAIGNSAMQATAAYAATGHVAVGQSALQNITSGTNDTAVGIYASLGLTTGSNNVAIGREAGRYRTGTTAETAYENCIFIGSSSRSGAANRTNQVVVGYDADGQGNNTVYLGNTSTLATNGLFCRSTTIVQPSDARLKQDVRLADGNLCLQAVQALPVRRFHWNEAYTNCDDEHVTGFIADEVEAVFPKSVVKRDMTFNGVELKDCKLTGMDQALPTLWGAVQKLIEHNEELRHEIAELKEKANGRTH